MLTAEAQIVGHYQLRKWLFSAFQISFDANLIRHLKSKDGAKERRQEFQKTKVYNSSHSTNRYAKFAEVHRSQLEDTKIGVKYESPVAVKEAKKLWNRLRNVIQKVHFHLIGNVRSITKINATLPDTATVVWWIVVCLVNRKRKGMGVVINTFRFVR